MPNLSQGHKSKSVILKIKMQPGLLFCFHCTHCGYIPWTSFFKQVTCTILVKVCHGLGTKFQVDSQHTLKSKINSRCKASKNDIILNLCQLPCQTFWDHRKVKLSCPTMSFGNKLLITFLPHMNLTK